MVKKPATGVIACVLAFVLASGCGGGTFLISVGSDGGNILFISGTCTSVQVVSTPGPNGGFITVTAVTFFDNGFNHSLNFCGNVAGMFPVNSALNVRYTSGNSCATAVSVTPR